MIPPKMLTRIAWTLVLSAVMILKASVTCSSVAPPPTEINGTNDWCVIGPQPELVCFTIEEVGRLSAAEFLQKIGDLVQANQMP